MPPPKGTSLAEDGSFKPSTAKIGPPVFALQVSKNKKGKERKGKVKKHETVILHVYVENSRMNGSG
jgi:hypothetical protein